ncbi:MAG: ribonucleoside-diphosphate reductase subunit alpha [Candidatus Omnitrophica bacterium CG11_big_fil_rev_8_21_14_0_20_63_9]|nr:MAG: ribonucleoside-diphosphate reductase subunit alpha [Candidatus Omnitrophica bacterium CG11_big_fil_rev_8_21_14_0_20_63_9]
MEQLAPHVATLTIKKRNGQHVPFFEARIQRAIESAWKEHIGLPPEASLPAADQAQVDAATQRVTLWCSTQATATGVVFIEDIQDAVIAHLREIGAPQVAERYDTYRRAQEHKRFETERLTVRKRDSRVVSFKPEKIAIAIGKAFAAEHPEARLSTATQQTILDVTDRVVAALRAGTPAVRTLDIEAIQDLVERMLLEAGHHEIARRYIRYRQEHARLRAHPPAPVPLTRQERLSVKTAEGATERFDVERLKLSIAAACHGLEERVAVELILQRTAANLFDGITTEQLTEATILAARSLIEEDPTYSFVAARLLLRRLYHEVLGRSIPPDALGAAYPAMFERAIRQAVEHDRLNPALLHFDLPRLGAALRPERDLQFAYMGLQTLHDRYFLHHDGRRLETPQIFWMRVAMGLAAREGDQRHERAIEFYDVMSTFAYVPSTPTLFNAGTQHSQLSSCFLTTIQDDLDHIFKSIKDNAMLSKWSGGLGNDWTPVRALGSLIKGTNGKSQGVVPFMKVANDTAVAVNQGGKRQGAVCAYLEVWHLDIEEFLELRKNTGDDRRRTHDMHTANWIPDLFMKRVLANTDWTLLSPNETADLHDVCGRAFEQRYETYERMAREGRLKQFKVIPAVQLWRKMLSMLFETGHPWITFKDPSNIRSPQDHVGVVHSSNLCTEILLNTSAEETAVCNLGSINLAAHTTPVGLDTEQLASTVRSAIRMLDNVIDLNYYPTPEAKTANARHRPVGLGVMGFQDALYLQGFSYASPQAVEFADESMELIAYHALLASSDLARERGAYESFPGSKWDRGLLPLDTLALLREERGGFLDVDTRSRLDWTPVREAIRRHGLRNSNTMAIAPTATIANIIGVSQSIEPTYKNLYVKSNLSGEFTTINPYLVDELRALGLWDRRMVEDVKYFDGILREIERIPQAVKDRYATAFEIGFEWLIECAARRQKWIDMGQSLNLYLAEASGKKLHTMYLMAWEKGLKTTYYLRSLGATRIEKSTVDANKYGNPLGQTSRPDAQQCRVGGDEHCEACQ